MEQSIIILVKEAGGKVTNFNGKKWKPERIDTVFSNSRIHDKILKTIESVE